MHSTKHLHNITILWHENAFSIIGPLWGESNGRCSIHLKKD